MQLLFIMMICIIAISVIVIAMVRIRLKNKSNELSDKLSQISSYSEKSNYEQAKERLSALNEKVFIDIPTNLNNGFYGNIIWCGGRECERNSDGAGDGSPVQQRYG